VEPNETRRSLTARKHALVTPVIDETCAILYQGKNLRHAVRDLMARELKAEG